MNAEQVSELVSELRADIDRLHRLPFIPPDIKAAVEKTFLLLTYLIERDEHGKTDHRAH